MLPQRHEDITFDGPIPLVARYSKRQFFNLAAGGFAVLLLTEILFQRVL